MRESKGVRRAVRDRLKKLEARALPDVSSHEGTLLALQGAIQRELVLIGENKQLAALVTTPSPPRRRSAAAGKPRQWRQLPLRSARFAGSRMSLAAVLASPRSQLSRSPPAPSTRSTPTSTCASGARPMVFSPRSSRIAAMARSRRGRPAHGLPFTKSIWRPSSAPLEHKHDQADQ